MSTDSRARASRCACIAVRQFRIQTVVLYIDCSSSYLIQVTRDGWLTRRVIRGSIRCSGAFLHGLAISRWQWDAFAFDSKGGGPRRMTGFHTATAIIYIAEISASP